ncbi:hypothetical protein B0H10DRAFT_1727665, partial [Mycena sp. CBHHK59/15]
CGIQAASGVFQMKHAWTGKNKDGEEVQIFEGFLSFNIVHSAMYRHKGHGNGDKHNFAFWAIRA